MWVGGGLTFLAVIVAWVLFRAPDIGAAVRVLRGMAGLGAPLAAADLRLLALAPLLGLAWLAPNSQTLVGYDPAGSAGAAATPGLAVARPLFAGLLFAAAFLSLSHVSEFIYYQF